MVVVLSLGERFRDLIRGRQLPTTFPEECWWAGRHPIANISIDLERDGSEEIARKLERWARVESSNCVFPEGRFGCGDTDGGRIGTMRAFDPPVNVEAFVACHNLAHI